MSALSRLRIGLAAAGLSCLVLGLAWAQEAEREYEREGAAEGRDIDIDREPGQSPRLQGQPHTAQFRGTQPGAAGQSEKVQNFLAGCLLQKNKAEVELGQFAQQQAENPQVKQFAQRMVQDHQQIVEKLQPLAGKHGAQSETAGQSDAGRQTAASQPGRTGDQQDTAIKQLMQIDRQITQRHFDAVRQELQQKQGTEFDKCYMASQIAGHMHMLAALQVIEQQGPDKLRQIAQQSQSSVEDHLQQAKQLMKQLEGDSTSRAQRPSERTQR